LTPSPLPEPTGAQPFALDGEAVAGGLAVCKRRASTSSPSVSPSQLTSERPERVGAGVAVSVGDGVAVAVAVGEAAGVAVGDAVGDAVGEGDGEEVGGDVGEGVGEAVGVVGLPTVMMPRIELPWTWQR